MAEGSENYQTGFMIMIYTTIWEILTRELSLLGQHSEAKKSHILGDVEPGVSQLILVFIHQFVYLVPVYLIVIFSNKLPFIYVTDMYAESRVEKPLPMYVPRDEQFEESKQDTFSFGRLKAVLHSLIPSLKASFSAENRDFSGFSDIDNLYSEGVLLKLGLQDELIKKLPLPTLVSRFQESQGILRYDTPKILSSKFLSVFHFDSFFLIIFLSK